MYKNYGSRRLHRVMNELACGGKVNEQVFSWLVLHWDLVNNISGLRVVSGNWLLTDGNYMSDSSFMKALRS